MTLPYTQSNVTHFFVYILLIFAFSSCSSDEEYDPVIPHTYVNITLHLDYYTQLNTTGTPVYIDNIAGKTQGYRGHGIIVMRLNDKFVAYDATCTHDTEIKEHLEIEGLFAKCPVCESKFNLYDSYPFKGSVARYPMKVYKTYFSSSNNTLRITN